MVEVVGATLCVPLIALEPVNVPPLAVHDVVLVEDQESVDEFPDVIDAGDAERETVWVFGGGEVELGALT